MSFAEEATDMGVDYEYLARTVAGFSGIPVRVYRGGEELCRCFPAPLPRDPMELCRGEVFAVSGHAGYYASPLFHFYGVINADGHRIVVGPTAQIMADEQKLRELAFRLGVPQEETPAFTEGMNAIARVPAETLLQLICSLNHLLNGGERLELSELAILEEEQTQIKTGIERRRASRVYEEESTQKRAHNTLALEEELADIVRRGDGAALKRALASVPALQVGTIAGDQLRQMRNLFIVTATVVSRAAIRGGMREDDAFSLSDAYIRRAELLTSYGKITNLQYNMLLEFTEQVGKLRRGGHVTKLSVEVADYVRHHLSEPVSVGKMAEELFLSRPYLSAKFKKETGGTLTDFILGEKTEEAKRLLRYSDRPLSAVSEYLGFSSPGHFSRVFRKYAGTTPNEYRERYR